MKKDLAGQRFGQLVALHPTAERRSGSVVWECKCDCGNTVLTSVNCLQSGKTRSCGCIKLGAEGVSRGMRFGRLVALRPSDIRKSGSVVWECLCDCGQMVYVRRAALQSGNTRSCGCLRRETVAERQKHMAASQRLEKEQKLQKNNTSGYRGVVYNLKAKKYVAIIGFQKKNHYLGTYKCVEDARDARRKAEILVLTEGERFYTRWKEKAEADPDWAVQNPMRIRAISDEKNGYTVMFLPEL